MSELETAAQQALVALEQFIEKELTVGQRYTKEGQALLDSIESLRGAFLQQEPATSPTSGMNIAQRILHVGGRNNAAGYVEFGSIQAVKALVTQVIRDLPKNTGGSCVMAQQQDQKPVAWADQISFDQAMKSGKGHDVWPNAGDYEVRTGRKLRAIYTHPPRREWRSLSEVEIKACLRIPAGRDELTRLEFARAVEDKLKELNHG